VIGSVASDSSKVRWEFHIVAICYLCFHLSPPEDFMRARIAQITNKLHTDRVEITDAAHWANRN